MADDTPKIIVDSDWKSEAKKEKERIQEQVEHADAPPIPEPSFPELIEMIVMQAVIGLGLMAGPRGERIPPQPEVAKHYIDMLDLLAKKTQGNTTVDEKKMLDETMYALRLRYVELVSGVPQPATDQKLGPANSGT